MAVIESEFQIVDVRADYPGACNITGEATGPFVQTDLYVNYDGRFCPKVELVERLGKAVGMIPAGEFERVVERMAELEQERDEAVKHAEQYDELRAAVLRTLQEGAVNRHGKIVLRAPRGGNRVEV